MNGQQKYTAEDIRLYLEGKLSSSQMHALEKEALSDPFLADALEGMQQYGQHDNFVSDAEELRWRLKEKVNTGAAVVRPAGMLWWKIAAILIIVITGVAVIIFTGERNNRQQGELAKTEQSKKIVVPMPPAATDSLQQASAPTPAPETSVRKSAKQRTPDAENLKKEKTPNADPGIAQKAGVQQKTAADSEINEMKAEESSPAVTGRAANEAPAMASEDLKSGTAGGYYREILLNGKNTRAKSHNARERSESEEASLQFMPEIGWYAFERYLKDSLNLTTPTPMEIMVSFIIDEKGLPASIRILKPSSTAHDREVTRLLREGPMWKVAPGEKRDVTLKIIF